MSVLSQWVSVNPQFKSAAESNFDNHLREERVAEKHTGLTAAQLYEFLGEAHSDPMGTQGRRDTVIRMFPQLFYTPGTKFPPNHDSTVSSTLFGDRVGGGSALPHSQEPLAHDAPQDLGGNMDPL